MPLSKCIKLSSVTGENVEVQRSGSLARWSPRHSGGWAYCETPLDPGHTYMVSVSGSGHYDIRFICKDIKDLRPPSRDKKPALKLLNEVRIHKKDCYIPVTLDKTGTVMTSEDSGRKFPVQLAPGSRVYLAVYIKFGEMAACIYRTDQPHARLKFSQHRGLNINLEAGKTRAVTIKKNPASICFTKEPVGVGEQLSVQCRPLTEDGRSPSRYDLVIYGYHRDPVHCSKEYKHLLKTSHPVSPAMPFKRLCSLEKNESSGDITVCVLDDTSVRVTDAEAKSSTCKITSDPGKGIWIVFELYRVELELKRKDKIHGEINRALVNDQTDGQPANAMACVQHNESDARDCHHSVRNTASYLPRDEPLYTSVKSRSEETELKQAYCHLTMAPTLPVFPRPQDHSRTTKSSPAAETFPTFTDFSKIHTDCIDPDKTIPKDVQPSKLVRPNIPIPYVEDTNIKDIWSVTDNNQFQDSNNNNNNSNNTLLPSRVDALEKEIGHIKKTIQLCVISKPTDNIPYIPNASDSGLPTDPVLNYQRHYVSLIRDLDPVTVSDHLYQDGIISESDMKEVQNKVLTNKSANKLLLEIMKQRCVRKSQLEPVLEACRQKHLISLFFGNSGS